MDEGFNIKKIDLANTSADAKHASGSGMNRPKPKMHMNSKKKKSSRKSLIFKVVSVLVLLLIVLGVAGYFTIFIPARETYAKAEVAMQKGKELKEATKSQDLQLMRTKLEESALSLDEVKASYAKLAWTKNIPFFGGYYRDGDHVLIATDELIQAGVIAVDALAPHADLLGLSEGNSSFVNQPANKRIEMAVQTLDKLIPELDSVVVHLKAAKEEIDKIDPSKYPAKIQGVQIRSKIVSGQELASEGIDTIVKIQPLIKLMPDLLGVNKVKRYLVLFQNDGELRSTGGFITAYAVFGVDKGSIGVEQSQDIYALDARQKKNIKASDEILKYHKGVYTANLRDSNISPDFAVSMGYFEKLLENISDPLQYDGIIAVDTHVLVEGMKVLDGKIYIPEYDTTFTVDPDPRCDGCPQVVYILEDFADRPTGNVRANRKDILGRLLSSFMKKALGVSPGQYWGPLVQTFITEANEKHVLVYMKDKDAQTAFETLNYAGRIQDYEGDYLHINDTNFAGAKSNMFVQHFVTQDIEIGTDGTVIKTITIDYKNPSPPSDCGLESGGLCLNGLLRNWLRIYVPKGSKLIEFTGAGEEGIETTTSEDLGKTVFEGFLTVRPEGSAQAVVKYELPFKVDNTYKMLIQKQPGTIGHEYTTIINGREMDIFNLTTDKEFEYKI